MSKIKVSVGIGRGRSMINYCRISDNAELVAVCDIWEPGLEKMKSEFKMKISAIIHHMTNF